MSIGVTLNPHHARACDTGARTPRNTSRACEQVSHWRTQGRGCRSTRRGPEAAEQSSHPEPAGVDDWELSRRQDERGDEAT